MSDLFYRPEPEPEEDLLAKLKRLAGYEALPAVSEVPKFEPGEHVKMEDGFHVPLGGDVQGEPYLGLANDGKEEWFYYVNVFDSEGPRGLEVWPERDLHRPERYDQPAESTLEDWMDIPPTGEEYYRTAAPKIPSMRQLQPHRYDSECYEVAHAIANQWPHLQQDSGFYVHPERGPGDHAWNIAPDGTIVDMTAVQHDYDGLASEEGWDEEKAPAPEHPEIIPPNHPFYPRYVSWTRHEIPAQEIAHSMGYHRGTKADKVDICPQCFPPKTAGEDPWGEMFQSWSDNADAANAPDTSQMPVPFIFSPTQKQIHWGTGPMGLHDEIINELARNGKKVPEDAYFGRYFPDNTQDPIYIYDAKFHRLPWSTQRRIMDLVYLNRPGFQDTLL